MSLNEHEDLSPAAANLARSAPREWDQFKAAFRKYAEGIRDELTMSSLEELQRVQGRAQNCNKLGLLFADAEKAADRISDRRNKKLAETLKN